MKINFKKPVKDPTIVNAMKIDYAPGRRMFPRIRWYLILLLVSTPLLAFIYGLVQGSLWIEARGYVTTPTVQRLATQIGTVSEVAVTAGERISAGQLLLRIEAPKLVQRLALLRLKHARGELVQGGRGYEIALQQQERGQQLERAQILKRRLEDVEFLWGQGAAPLADLEQARLDLTLTTTQSLRSSMELTRLQDATADEARRVHREQQQELADEISLQEENLAGLEVRAAQNGRVASVLVVPGDDVLSGSPLLRLTHVKQPALIAYLAPNHAESLTVGRQVEVFFPNGQRSAAVISEIAPEAAELPGQYDTSYTHRSASIVFRCTFSAPETLPELIYGSPVTVRLGSRLAFD